MRTGDPVRGSEQDGEGKKKRKKRKESNLEKETKEHGGHGDMMGQFLLRVALREAWFQHGAVPRGGINQNRIIAAKQMSQTT